MRLRKYVTPTSAIYALVHLVILLLGFLCLFVPGVRKTLGDAIADGIGSAFIATAVTGTVIFVYVLFTDEIKDRLKIVTDAGATKVLPYRAAMIKPEYDVRLSKARSIDIIGFGLSSFREDYAQEFATWSRVAKVRVLLLDPNFPHEGPSYANQRDIEEGNDPGRVSEGVRRFLETVARNHEIDRTRFEIRLLMALPAVNFFRINDEILWGPNLILQPGRTTFTIVVRRGGYLFDALADHFERLWSDPRFSRPT